jgi:GSH-dependent disulfide-bond oxidoreductase
LAAAGRERVPGWNAVHHRRHSGLALVRRARQGLVYEAGEFLQVADYKNVQRWTDAIAKRPAVQRGRMVNRIFGDPASQLRERHEASDFDTKTQDKVAEAG